MTKSLSTKIFLVTITSFFALILLMMTFIYVYFTVFYEELKINNAIEGIDSIAIKYINAAPSDKHLAILANEFMSENNASMTIYRYPADYYETFEDGFFDYVEFSEDVSVGDSIDSSYVDAIDTVYSESEFDANEQFFDLYMSDISIVDNAADFYNSDDYLKSYESGDIQYFIYSFPDSNIRQVDFIRYVDNIDGSTTEFFVNLSLQSVDELMTMFRTYSPYMVLILLLLSLLISRLSSKFISRPIIHITKTASKMAALDFEAKCQVDRSDEIGDLAASLNQLSSNLMAQETMRREFVANVSHELKSPLGVIKSYSEALADDVNPSKKDYYQKVITHEINNMNQLIEEMLTLSKYEVGAFKYNKKPIDLAPSIDRILNNYKPFITEKLLAIELDGEFNHDQIDLGKINQVLNNLIKNAINYAHNESLIKIVGSKDDINHLTIKIFNDCEAMDDDTLAKLWERFYTSDTSHNKKTSGTGLGLSICKSILEGHGCDYGVYSTNSGICFYFTIKS